MKKLPKFLETWQWIVTKTGELRQVTEADQMSEGYSDIERLATKKEIKDKRVYK